MSSEQSLKDVFNSIKESLLTNNVIQLNNLISEDYIGFSLHGTIESKSDIIKSFKPNSVKLSVYSVEDMSIEIFKNIGVITGKGIISGKYQSFEFHHNVLFTDIFKLVKGNWKYYKSQVTEIRSALTGTMLKS